MKLPLGKTRFQRQHHRHGAAAIAAQLRKAVVRWLAKFGMGAQTAGSVVPPRRPVGWGSCRLARLAGHLVHSATRRRPAADTAALAGSAPAAAAAPPLLLTAEHQRSWAEDGYLVVRGCVPAATVDAVVSDIWQFLRMDPSDPSTWYTLMDGMTRVPLEVDDAGVRSCTNTMLNMWQHQSMCKSTRNPGATPYHSLIFREPLSRLLVMQGISGSTPACIRPSQSCGAPSSSRCPSIRGT